MQMKFHGLPHPQDKGSAAGFPSCGTLWDGSVSGLQVSIRLNFFIVFQYCPVLNVILKDQAAERGAGQGLGRWILGS